MREYKNVIVAYSIMILLIILVGIFQSWGIALSILNLCLISAVMTMGANIQWGYAGLINFGVMGYTALGGLAAVLVSVAPVKEAWSAGGINMIACLFIIMGMIISIRYILKKFIKSKGKPEENSIEKFAIRSMSKAKYSTNKERHFGLSFNNYRNDLFYKIYFKKIYKI